jgi:hypothetical protein
VNNTVTLGSSYATIGGGVANQALAVSATVAGGESNSALSIASTVGGGRSNNASSNYATVAGGLDNTANGPFGATAGGQDNQAGNRAFVGGGRTNRATGKYAVVGGGGGDISGYPNWYVNNQAAGDWSTIPGGANNRASGDFSFAAGRGALASHDGSFVWHDSNIAGAGPFFWFPSSGPDEFSVYAGGGIRMFSSSDGSTGMELPPGAFLWAPVSDRDAKEDFETIDQRATLEAVASLPITRWSYKAEADAIRHMGPMAQDFFAAFGLGYNDRTVTSIDLNGVSLAAIQGLDLRVDDVEADKDARLAEQQEQIDALRAEVEALTAELRAQGGR